MSNQDGLSDRFKDLYFVKTEKSEERLPEGRGLRFDSQGGGSTFYSFRGTEEDFSKLVELLVEQGYIVEKCTRAERDHKTGDGPLWTKNRSGIHQF